MFAVIHLPDLALQALLRHEPELRARPVALVDGPVANPARVRVWQCTPAAAAAGVCAGLPAPQAQARCQELVLKGRLPGAERDATEILLQTAGAFSPHLEHTAPGVGTIDLRGLVFEDTAGEIQNEETRIESSMPGGWQQDFAFLREAPTAPLPAANSGPLERWAGRIVAVLKQLHLEARVGLAATPGLALLAAQAARPVRVVADVPEFLRSLPLAALEPPAPLLDILRRWGLSTAGAFLELGREAVAERLGAEALALFDRADARAIRPLRLMVPPDTFAERMDFEARVETLEPLLFVLHRFVGQLATRLAQNHHVAGELYLRLELESGPALERAFQVPAPTARVDTLFRMLQTHLENLRTDAPVVSLRLAATPARAEAQQFGLFESALRDPNRFHETLARLVALFGPERAGTPVAEATHRPDAFRMQKPEFGMRSGAPGNFEPEPSAGLCLRRYRPALPAEVELEAGRPVFIRTLVMSGAVRRARGPWRASGAWWDERRWARQEWDVETCDGAVYRLFQTDGDWRVEGVYD